MEVEADSLGFVDHFIAWVAAPAAANSSLTKPLKSAKMKASFPFLILGVCIMKVVCFPLMMGLILPIWAQISFVDKKADGQDPGVDVLRGAYTPAISPDGRHIYAPGSLDHGLVVFAMDRFSGQLSLVETHVDGQAGISSLASCRGAAVSPDGKHVYTVALTDSAVTVFSRNTATGALTLVQAIFDLNTGGSFDGLGGAMAVAISPDGEHVYVAARSDDAVVAFARNAMTGQLTLIGVYQNLVPPIQGLNGAESIALSPDGKHVYVAGMIDQAIAVFSRNELTGALTFVTAYFDGVNGIDGLGCTNDVAVSADGAHVYAVGQFGAPSQPFCPVGFDDWMAIFARDADTGELSLVDTVSPDDFNLPINCGGVAADNGVVVSPDGGSVYVTSQWHGAILELARNPTSGLVTLQSFDCADLSDPNTILDLLSAHRVVSEPTGHRLLVSALSPGTVLVYETAAYHNFRQGVEAWPIGIDLLDLLLLLEPQD